MDYKTTRNSKKILKDIWDGKPIDKAVSSLYSPVVFTDHLNTFCVNRIDGKAGLELTQEEFNDFCSKYGPFLVLAIRDDEAE